MSKYMPNKLKVSFDTTLERMTSPPIRQQDIQQNQRTLQLHPQSKQFNQQKYQEIGKPRQKQFNHQRCNHQQYNIEQIQSQIKQKLRISQTLLKDEEIIQINILPIKEQKTNNQVQQLIRINLLMNKAKKDNQKLILEQERKIRDEKLHILNEKAKKILNKSKKKKADNQIKWGHNIFSQYQNQHNQRHIKPQKSQSHQKKNKQQNSKKVELKPINQRIRQYKKNQKLEDQKKNKHFGLDCCHKEITEAQIQKKRQQIQKNANFALKKIKQEELKRQEDKKIIQGKIRAIQLKSKENIRKSKKRPVENGEFVFSKTDYSSFSQIGRKNKQLQQNKKNKNEKQLETINIQDQKKKRKQGDYIDKKMTIQDLSEEQLPQKSLFNKFYIWNIPIQFSDYEKIISEEEMLKRTKIYNFKTSKQLTFRQQVEKHLATKFHKRMLDERIKSNQQLFKQKVQQKKQAILRQFNQSESLFKEQFWNEDELFRGHPIQNFHYYPPINRQ